LSLRASLTTFVDVIFNIDRRCADLDRGFLSEGAEFRFEYGTESFLVSASMKDALRQQYRERTRRSTGLILLAALVGASLAIGADLATGRATPQWLIFSILLGPIVLAGVALWRDEMRTWDGLIAQMRQHSTNTKALAPAPRP
jgi:hypothetical protein